MFSVMWSEHCSYKSSKPLLRTLPTEGRGVVAGPGENAGVISIGDGLAVAFKIESHNHPSARSSPTRARRPASAASCATSSRWAPGRSPCSTRCASAIRRTRGRATSSTASSAGSAATATASACRRSAASWSSTRATRATRSSTSWRSACSRSGSLTRAAAPGPGNLVVLFGSATGRDGIGGASVLASATFADDDPSKRPSVQVGDPFAEKLLIEASLELIERGPGRGAPGPRRRRDHLRDLGDRRPGGTGMRSTSTRSRGASRAWRPSR